VTTTVNYSPPGESEVHGWEAYVSTDVGLSSEFGLPLRTTSVPSTPEPDLENLLQTDRNCSRNQNIREIYDRNENIQEIHFLLLSFLAWSSSWSEGVSKTIEPVDSIQK
jgi:hypothetical protein